MNDKNKGLDDLNLIVGPNGSGKTNFLNILYMFFFERDKLKNEHNGDNPSSYYYYIERTHYK